MAVTVATFVQQARDLLEDNPWRDYESGALASGGTALTVADGTDWQEGDIVEWSDGDQAYVRSVAGNILTLKRNINGITATGHSDGDEVFKNPRFSYYRIQRAGQTVMKMLFPWAWQVTSATVTTTATTEWHDLGDSDALDLVQVSQLYGSSSQYVGVYGRRVNNYNYAISFARNLPTALVASGVGFRFPGGKFSPTNSLKVDYRERFQGTVSGGSFTELSDDEGLYCVVLGTVAQLVSATDITRSTQEDTTMADSSVNVGQRTRVGGYWYDLHREELYNWYHRLLAAGKGPMGSKKV